MKTSFSYYVTLLSVLFFSIAQGQTNTITWQDFDIKRSQKSAGFIDVYDADGDGKQEVLLSTLQESGGGFFPARGALRLFISEESTSLTDRWDERLLISTNAGMGFINHPYFMDIDGDNVQDILVHQGFLTTNDGSYFWLKGPEYNYNDRRYISPETEDSDFFWHETVQIDLDQDGKLDLISTSANTNVQPAAKRIEWYRNLGNGNFEQHILNNNLGGVFIKTYDVDADGDQDIIVSQFFISSNEPSLVWLEQKVKPSAVNNWKGDWETHNIDQTTGLGYHIEFYDIDADGQQELVYANHNNLNNNAIVDESGNSIESGVYWFEIPEDPKSATAWEKHVIDEHFPVNTFDFGNPASQGSPGIFSIGDIDNDGYPDMVLPGDGTQDLFFLHQKPDNTFERSVIATGKMFGMAKIVDMDNDGTLEVVAAMHNFPSNFFQAIFNFPKGNLKIYNPIISNQREADKEVEEFKQNVSIFPNPLTTKMTLSLNSDKTKEVAIMIVNKMGERHRLIERTLEKGQNQIEINVANLPKGYYQLVIKGENMWEVKRFIKR